MVKGKRRGSAKEKEKVRVLALAPKRVLVIRINSASTSKMVTAGTTQGKIACIAITATCCLTDILSGPKAAAVKTKAKAEAANPKTKAGEAPSDVLAVLRPR